jgi:hypothetical protein
VLLPDAAPDDVPVFEPLLLVPLSGLSVFDVLLLVALVSPDPFELGTLPRLSVT